MYRIHTKYRYHSLNTVVPSFGFYSCKLSDTRFLLSNLERFTDDQGKPEDPHRHRARRSAVGGDGTRRTVRPLDKAKNADSGDTKLLTLLAGSLASLWSVLAAG